MVLVGEVESGCVPDTGEQGPRPLCQVVRCARFVSAAEEVVGSSYGCNAEFRDVSESVHSDRASDVCKSREVIGTEQEACPSGGVFVEDVSPRVTKGVVMN